MDLDYQKRRDFSKHLIDSYIQSSGDQDVLEVLDFYKCYRAYMRGKWRVSGLMIQISPS